MRILLVIVAGLLIGQYGIAQEGPPGGGGGRGGGRGAGRGGGRGPVEPPPPPKPGFTECFDHAATPEYPQAALQQHVDGDVWVTFDLTAQGMPEKIQMEVSSAWAAGEKLLTPAVEKAVKASTFKSSCAGKSIAVVYRYDLSGDPVASPKPTTKTDARIMYIESAPELAAKRAAK